MYEFVVRILKEEEIRSEIRLRRAVRQFSIIGLQADLIYYYLLVYF